MTDTPKRMLVLEDGPIAYYTSDDGKTIPMVKPLSGEREEWEIVVVKTVSAAWHMLTHVPFQAFSCDYNLSPGNSEELIRRLCKRKHARILRGDLAVRMHSNDPGIAEEMVALLVDAGYSAHAGSLV